MKPLNVYRAGLAPAAKSSGVHHDGPTNMERAVELYREAAEGGHVPSQFEMGLIYSYRAEHYGVEPDWEQAAQWFLKGALEGDYMSCTNMASFYGNGVGVLQSSAKAKKWFERGAALGDPCALEHLVMMNKKGYREGDVFVSQEDIEIATRAFRVATSELDGAARKARNGLRSGKKAGCAGRVSFMDHVPKL